MTPITPNNALAGIEMVQAAAIMLSRVALIAISTKLQSPITADCSSSPEKGGLFLEYFVADGVIASRSLTPAGPTPLGLIFPMFSLGVSTPLSPAIVSHYCSLYHGTCRVLCGLFNVFGDAPFILIAGGVKSP